MHLLLTYTHIIPQCKLKHNKKVGQPKLSDIVFLETCIIVVVLTIIVLAVIVLTVSIRIIVLYRSTLTVVIIRIIVVVCLLIWIISLLRITAHIVVSTVVTAAIYRIAGIVSVRTKRKYRETYIREENRKNSESCSLTVSPCKSCTKHAIENYVCNRYNCQ